MKLVVALRIVQCYSGIMKKQNVKKKRKKKEFATNNIFFLPCKLCLLIMMSITSTIS